MGTQPKHITELCKHSRRIDFYQATPSLIVTVLTPAEN